MHDAVTSPAAIAEALVGLAETGGGVMVLIVDQAEELFTMCADDSRRTAFAEVLVRASASPRIRVVLALRDDFLCRIEQLPAWRGLLGRAVHVLGVPRREDLERMLTVPARGRGFRFDDPDLPREIVDQVADRPGALPLIAFTAAQLWERRDRRLRRLTRSAYHQLGGVTAFDLLTSHAVASLDAGLDVLGHGQAGIVGMDIGATAIVTLGSDLRLSRWDRAGHAVALADRTYCATLVGDLAISVSTQGDVAAIDERGRVRWRVEHALAAPDTRCGIAGSAAARLVVAFGRTVTLWDLDSGRARGGLAHGKDVSAAAIAADGSRLATGDLAGVTRIWDTTTAALVATCEPHTGAVRAIQFAADRRSVVTGGNDADVRISDTATGATLHRLIRLWRLGTWAPVTTLVGHKSSVSDLWFLSDGRLVSAAADATLVWGRDGGLLARLADTSYVFALATTPDGTLFATTGSDGAIRVWDAATYRLLLQRPARGLPAQALRLTHDGAATVSAATTAGS